MYICTLLTYPISCFIHLIEQTLHTFSIITNIKQKTEGSRLSLPSTMGWLEQHERISQNFNLTQKRQLPRPKHRWFPQRSRSDLEWLDGWVPPEWIYSEPDEEV